MATASYCADFVLRGCSSTTSARTILWTDSGSHGPMIVALPLPAAEAVRDKPPQIRDNADAGIVISRRPRSLEWGADDLREHLTI